MIKKDKKKIILSGGGSGGSVTTLLVVAREIIKENEAWDFVFVGTKRGPEKLMVESFFSEINKIKFISLPSGKLRRYFSIANFFDFFKILSAFFVSFFIINREKPSLIISAGGFPSVPFVWASYLKKIPILIHQQDVRPGLANKLMAPFARLITVTFEKSLRDYGPKAVWIGNPVNRLPIEELNSVKVFEKYKLNLEQPLVLVTGGGTGSAGINDLVRRGIKELSSLAQIVHLTGQGKSSGISGIDNYHSFELLPSDEVFKLMNVAAVVVSRCGLATLTELCALGKPAVLIPMPNSHQEDNAIVFERAKAALVLKQQVISELELVDSIKQILENNDLRKQLSANISKIMKQEAAGTMAGLIGEILASKK